MHQDLLSQALPSVTEPIHQNHVQQSPNLLPTQSGVDLHAQEGALYQSAERVDSNSDELADLSMLEQISQV
jgi:hypothetical protein